MYRSVRQVVVVALLLAGCSRPHVVDGAPDRLPEPFILELRAISAGQRAVYYVLEADGTLRYGGGRFATTRQAVRDVGRLAAEERLRLWRTITAHHLLDARGQFLPSGGRDVYELKVRAGRRRNAFTAADDAVPGLAELERALFEMQAARRFEAP